MKIGFLITARLKSKRLPRKIVRNVNGEPLIVHMIKRLKHSKEVDEIIICTSKLKQDDLLEKISRTEGVKCYRGHSDDVLKRLSKAAAKHKLSYILNITADCPLVDPFYADKIVKLYRKTNADLIRAFDLPHGAFSYGFKISALNKAIKIKNTKFTANWEKYFTDTGIFKIVDLKVKNKLHRRPGLRMTLDYPEDLKFFKRVFKELYYKKNFFNLTDIINLLNRKPEIIEINKNCGLKFMKKYIKESEFILKKKIKIKKKNLKLYKKFSEIIL